MNILENIANHKKEEVRKRRELYPEKLLETSIYFDIQPVSLKKYLQRADKVGIIAEFKRKSPSKGMINQYASVEQVSIGYMQAGASALSILTDSEFFGGKSEDLKNARKFNYCPILRKDFILDEYQIIEAKSLGADVILLIAAMLTPQEVSRLGAFAHQLGLEVLLEVHDAPEIQNYVCDEIDIVGINNRNLKDFTLDLNISYNLVSSIPDKFLKVSESAIHTPQDVVNLKKAGFSGFLIGERFMKTSRPNQACSEFIQKVEELIEAK